MSKDSKITPPEIPTVDRKTGAVSNTKEYPDLATYAVDGYEGPSTDPFYCGQDVFNFNDECPADQRKKAVADFYKK